MGTGTVFAYLIGKYPAAHTGTYTASVQFAVPLSSLSFFQDAVIQTVNYSLVFLHLTPKIYSPSSRQSYHPIKGMVLPLPCLTSPISP